jgi:glycolate oxidase FAD binding subunit
VAGGTAFRPTTAAEVAEALAAHAQAGRSVRITGGGTRAGWGSPVTADAELSTTGLDRIAEHSAGDFTAVLGAGVPFEEAQATFAEHGQMLAVDPPPAPGATIGGLVATADAGPRRHRYGAIRDLVIGMTVALPDGTVAKSGGKVIKNVAGYDLAKLNAGAFGTLGVITQVAVRLHPLPAATATARFAVGDPDEAGRIAANLAHRPLELDALDVAWAGGEGAILARFAGPTCGEQAASLEGCEAVGDDGELWEAQRAGQRAAAPGEVVVRVSGLPSELPSVLRAADAAGARVAGRAAVGTSYLRLPAGTGADDVRRLRETLGEAPCVVLDAPAELRAQLDPWDVGEGGELMLARRLKERFDPARVCNPGIYVGGI